MHRRHSLLPVLAAVVLFGMPAGCEKPAPPPVSPAVNLPPPPPMAPSFERWARFEQGDEQRLAIARSHYMNAMLGHQVYRVPPAGIPPRIAQNLILDDDELLLSSGRRLWTREALHQPGFAGKFCYLHSTYCLKRVFDVAFFADGRPLAIYDNQYQIERYPSHTTVRYQLGDLTIKEHKFITYDDRIVAHYEVTTNQDAHDFTIEVIAPYPLVPQPQRSPAYPLMGHGVWQGSPVVIYLDAPGFERLDGDQVHLRHRLRVEPGGEAASATVALRFEAEERPVADPPLTSKPVEVQAHEYQKWFAENIPYFDAPDYAFKRMWYYRWWIVRFHLTEANSHHLNGFVFYEGKLGFDNLIGFAVPLQLKELTYLRDPRYGISQARNSYRNRAKNGAVVDPPGSPYWNETYSHWSAMALAELNRVHSIPASELVAMLPDIAADVRAWMSAYDKDGDALPEREMPRVTGYDLDILSFWYFNNFRVDPYAEPRPLERVDFASFVFANAMGLAELAEVVGDQALVSEFRERAERIRGAVLTELWDEASGFFYPRPAASTDLIPIRELHGFFPFTTLLAPDEPRYHRALEKMVDPEEFWARYPPVITSVAHYKKWTWEMDGLTRNIAPHPISMGGRTLLQVLKHYPKQKVIRSEHFMELMARYNDLVYPGVHPGDPLWRPNVHEYYSKWEPYALQPRPKPSDISHDFHSMYNCLIVEGVAGLTPRRDGKIELQPLAQDWSYFLFDRLRYRNHDLTIVWDKPDGNVRYAGYPEGFSLYVNDTRAFTRSALDHVVFDPVTGNVEVR